MTLAPEPVSPPPVPASRRRMELAILGLLGLALVWIAVTIDQPAEEDAFIYYRYAWNWAHGQGLAFNPGDPLEGFSGPLWMAILGLVARLGLDLPRTAPLLGLGCALGALLAMYRLARTAGVGRWGRVGAAAGVALSYPFCLWARSGLETTFYSLLLVVACEAYLAATVCAPSSPGKGGGEGLSRRQWLAGLALCPVPLGRPEGLLLLGVVVGHRLWRRDPAGALRCGLPAALSYLVFLAWRWATFHSLVPNTSVKVYPLLFARSLPQLGGYLLYLGLLAPLLPLVLLVRRRRSRAQTAAREIEGREEGAGFLFAAFLVVSVFFSIASGGDYRQGFRYLVPTLPVLLVAAWLAAERLQGRKSGAGLGALGTLLLASTLLGPAVSLVQSPPTWSAFERVAATWCDPYHESSWWGIPIARWIDANVPPGSVVAFGQMGRVPYYLSRRGHPVAFLDTMGLVDRDVARVYRFDRKLGDLAAALREGLPLGAAIARGRETRAREVAASLLARRPDFILVETELEDFAMIRALFARSEMKTDYRQLPDLENGGGLPVRVFVRRVR